MRRQKHLSLKISLGPYSAFIDRIIELAEVRQSSYVCVANVHMLIEAKNDKSFRKALIAADVVTPDGMPLAKALKLLYGIDQDRVAGMDLLPDLLAKAEKEALSVFFYGGSQAMLDKAVKYTEERYPQLNLAGAYSPPFRPLSEEEMKEVAHVITTSGAQIVFVVLGCPKQEKWMYQMKGKIPAVMIGIGGALPVLIGDQKRAPQWMQKYSLEWSYRLMQEPRRLFKRYLVTNSSYLVLLFGQKVKLMFLKKKG
ncbi:N-acetylglucosaminyldiphosphoundecaprenol N-acetyl-beta-D-mannosaminyltransferase [Filimonas zeae]|uniref:UDP-N-acetyl-D-mannosaminuronic acid transferase n=1 Tax=Filimonas zeae TaxID=1737353 RepID=A0A917MRN9_9BACT|nr:WecB/TagA/CpsF family glycosyltransferase [Filimonas zeae]MDR6337006.1 N-acetylglucosaminyldiphosphoundecaprenol N-acetyl-beta-D-mannosaminyltransferase [Filimonas zeae]GGH56552.1 UDP-N-acetyl-D-mannosaminuronic acid transferase [Filimonas zeae]